MEELLAQLSPEELAQLLGLGTMDERSQLLQQQLAQAEALRSGPQQHHSTGLGAALGGLGDVVKNVAGSMKAQKLNDQMAGLADEKDKRRQLYLKALRGESLSPAATQLTPVDSSPEAWAQWPGVG